MLILNATNPREPKDSAAYRSAFVVLFSSVQEYGEIFSSEENYKCYIESVESFITSHGMVNPAIVGVLVQSSKLRGKPFLLSYRFGFMLSSMDEGEPFDAETLAKTRIPWHELEWRKPWLSLVDREKEMLRQQAIMDDFGPPPWL